jgi:hypothetical protein
MLRRRSVPASMIQEGGEDLRRHASRQKDGPMKFMTIVGIILIVLGVVAFAYQGITYTTREQVVDIGPVEVTKETKKTIPLPPILGGLALASGVVLMVAGARR